jgi:hypothetical protein
LNIQITVTEEDLQKLHDGTAVTKSIRGGVVQLVPDKDPYSGEPWEPWPQDPEK